ncbi:MAG: tetratricopeptide repeat protein [Bacteroidota bacterium]
MAINGLAKIKRITGDFEAALTLYERGLTITEELEDDRTKAGLLSNIGRVYFDLGDHPTSLRYHKRAFTVRKKASNKAELSNSYLNIGIAYARLLSYDSALFYYSKALQMDKELGLKFNIVVHCNNMGSVYIETGRYDDALEKYFEGLKAAEELALKTIPATLCTNIAEVFKLQKEYEKSLKYHNESLKLRQQEQDKVSVAESYFNIAKVYRSMENHEQALNYYNKSIEAEQEMGRDRQLGVLYNSIGLLHMDMGDYEKALEYTEESLVLSEKSDDIATQAGNYANLSLIYTKQGKSKEAATTADKALQLAEETGLADVIKEASLTSYKANAVLGNYKEAYEVLKLHKEMSDSLLNTEQTKKLTQLESKYLYDKKTDSLQTVQEQEKLVLNTAIEKRNTQLLGASGGAVALLLIAFLLFRQRQVKAKANRLLSEQKEEIQLQAEELQVANERLESLGDFKEKMTGMLVHDLKNPLNSVLFATRDSEDNSKGQLAYRASLQMLTMVSNMLDIQKFDDTKVKLDKQIHPIHGLLEEAVGYVSLVASPKKLVFVCSTEPESLEASFDRDLILRVLINLLTNAIKFSEFEGKITLEATQITEGVQVSVKDEGEGIPTEELEHIFERFAQVEARRGSTGLGLTFCKLAVEAHDGTISVTSKEDEGSTFSFILPV